MRAFVFIVTFSLGCSPATARGPQPTAVTLPTVPVATPPSAVATASAPPRVHKPMSGEILETRTFGGDGDVGGGTIALDARGNAFIVGSFHGTATFGDLPALTAVGEDAYVLALDASMRPMWSKRIGGTGPDYGNDVAVDTIDGGVYVSGAFESPVIDLGSGPLRDAGVHDLFLAKYDVSGKLVFAKRFGDWQDQISLHLRAHPHGGVVATGWFNGTIDFGAGPVTSPFGKASFVARLDPNGRAKWSHAFGHRLDYAETDAIVDSRDHVFVSGGSDEAILPAGKPSRKDDLGPVLLELDDAGVIVSTKRFGRGADNVSTAIALDGTGAIRFAVGSRGVVDFGDGPRKPNGFLESMYVTQLDARGTLLWSTEIASERLSAIESVNVDVRGDTIASGMMMRHEAEPAPYGSDTSRGVVVKLSATGSVVWTRVLMTGQRTSATRIVFDSHGRIVISGSTTHPIGTTASFANSLAITILEP